MPAFRYEAVDARGKPRRGLIDAESPRQVRDQLRGEGLFPTAIDAANSPDAGGAIDRTRLSPALVSLTTRLLATLTRSGMPVDQALAAVAEQADDARAAKVFTALRTQVAAGETLAVALARWPRTFSELYRGLAAVGAETGRLPDVLTRLADYLEARQALRQKFTLALIYPALVTVIALAVIAVLLVYVVPQVVSVYQQSRQTLPWLTQALIAVSGFFRATGWFWLAGMGAFVVAFVVANRRIAFRARWHAALLRLPVAREARHRSGHCALCEHALDPHGQRRAAAARARCRARRRLGVATQARGGHVGGAGPRRRVARAGAEGAGVFPPVLIHLVANGEASGQLAPMLARAADELEREAERRLTWFAALLQPALIVAMGAIVLVLVLAVMLPIVSMNQLIR